MRKPLLPKSLKIGKRRYAVTVQRHLTRSSMGRIDYRQSLITLATHSKVTGWRYESSEIHETFWHEVTHGVLREMNHPLEGSETFVSRFAQLLTQAIETARFEDQG